MPPHPAPAPAPTPQPLKILMLHGYTQTPTLFRAKTRALAKSLSKPYPTLHLAYVPAPHPLLPADIPGHDGPGLDDDAAAAAAAAAPEAYGWWRRKDGIVKDGQQQLQQQGKKKKKDNDDETAAARGEVVYEGLEQGLARVAECIRDEGPFDGVVGFSQGAAAAAMVASLLEGRGRREAFGRVGGGMPYPASFVGDVDGCVQGPLRFAVCYGGFRAPGRRYAGFYEPRIGTRVLHVMGQVDVVVDEVRGMELVAACEGGEGRVVVHPGGHFVPSQKPWLNAVVGFVKQCMEGEGKREEKEEKVEDMDVPF